MVKKAADLGHAVAQYNCGVFLLKRVSEDNSHEEDALSYLNKAAEQGYAPTMTQLGKYYLERSDAESEKGKQNSESAFFWLKKAASLANFEAQTLLKETEEKKEQAEESLPSQDLQKCLKNLENIENGAMDTTKELELKTEKRSLPFVEPIKDDNEIESSSDESEIVPTATNTSFTATSSFSTPSSVVLQTGEFSTPPLDDKKDALLTPPAPEEGADISVPIPLHKDNNIFKNIKYLRAHLKEAGLAFKKKKENAQQSKEVALNPDSSLIISTLKSKKERENITYASLYKLFSDPYFKNKGHIELKKTKSGLSIVGKCFISMSSYSAEEVMTTGTHHNHNKTYKGYNPEFLKEVVKIVEMFN